MSQLMTIGEASRWATDFLGKDITPSNISYLIQYGRVAKYGHNGRTLVNKSELKGYYESQKPKEKAWKKSLGQDLNWALSFDEYKESERSKHVHRLHPYKGKFIPQLVEYFLDSHTDNFKQEIYFKPGDIVLDPFCGSGTTLVQANELGMHSVGIDISAFNALISNVKTGRYNLFNITEKVKDITNKLLKFQKDRCNVTFENELLYELKIFNDKYFPVPEFKRKVRNKEIDEKEYSKKKETEFLHIYNKLTDKYQIKLKQAKSSSFLDKWFLQPVRKEIDFVFEQIKQIENIPEKKVLEIILSRTIRSCRATTHADLGTLKEPVTAAYYCKKHGKMCKPLFSISSWWERYSKDTIKRFFQFDKLRTETFQKCLVGDSRTVDIFEKLENGFSEFGKLVREKKIKGIFSSPPYVGLIDYHEQHAYAYDLFDFERQDELEIGHLCKGQGAKARDSYKNGIAQVLLNSRKFLQDDYDIFLVANDKFGIYPQIAEMASMKIVNQYKRPVLDRVEKDRSAYSEIIFHLKEN
ncbi:MAG: site-specific DNA-methyltransferase [Desulfobacteraceae bacterium]|nr:site-specific DNA-methyltransferase [Desulfobacteraceae bacterium]